MTRHAYEFPHPPQHVPGRRRPRRHRPDPRYGHRRARRRATALAACAPGQLCLWAKPDFKGAKQVHELSTVSINSCTALPPGTSAQSLANRVGRPVTTYQSAECAETGEFQTYPGDGVWLPSSPYQVRAFKVWER